MPPMRMRAGSAAAVALNRSAIDDGLSSLVGAAAARAGASCALATAGLRNTSTRFSLASSERMARA